MIVESARKAIEDAGNHTHDQYCTWDYLSLKIDNDIYRIIFEYSSFYGELIRQWLINDNNVTTVKDKYDGELVKFDCSNGRIGIRRFEHDSIAWEFLLKPMGIPENLYLNTKKENFGYISKYKLMNMLKESNIEFEILYDTTY